MYSPENNKELKTKFNNENNPSYCKDNKIKLGNNNYYNIIIRGIIWIFMLIFSLSGLIFVFKDNYSDKEFIVVSNKNNYYLNSINDNISEENKDFLSKYSKDEDFSLNKSDSKPFPTGIKKNVPDDNTNNTINDFSKDNLNNSINNNETKNAKDSNQELKETLNNLIKEITNNGTPSEVEKPNINISKKTNNPVPVPNLRKVWLVTIYSSIDLSNAKSKWIEIQNKHSSLFNNKKVYFIKTNIPGKGVYYRVSLGDVQINSDKPSFNTSIEASNYCKYLKDNNVSCFITEVEENNLDKIK